MRVAAAFIFGGIVGGLWGQLAPLLAGPSDTWSLLTWVVFIAITFILGIIAGKITTLVP